MKNQYDKCTKRVHNQAKVKIGNACRSYLNRENYLFLFLKVHWISHLFDLVSFNLFAVIDLPLLCLHQKLIYKNQLKKKGIYIPGSVFNSIRRSISFSGCDSFRCASRGC